MKQRTHIVLAILLPVQIGLVNLLSRFPHFVETYYSNGVYPVISKIERFLVGWTPFSIGDFLYAFLVIALLRWIYFRFKTKFKTPKKWIIEAAAILSIMYGVFHILWGFNYYRLPLHRALEIENNYTTEELMAFTKELIQTSNSLQLQITQDDSLKVDFPFKKHEIRKITIDGFENIEQEFPKLDYNQKSLKPSLFSIPLTYMGFNGYLNPFTNEAQVNNQLPKFKLPSTASHEVGHQLGFAKENEANFIACLVTMNHPNIYFRYAGNTFALQYCLAELHRREPKTTEILVKTLNYGVRLNYREMDEFWEAHENPFEPFFKIFYGSYLQVNNQPDGMKSYSYVVALLVNYEPHPELQKAIPTSPKGR
ncbi:MAG TPA: DUF3810 domain-containing protein [Flavobacteriaceae bacterium]|nr:DUF3810 domain-containing protein [Flavobacteriaceae bacterium]